MKIFQRVHCKAYMAKYKDGVRLICNERKKHTVFGQEQIMEEPAKGSAWDEYKDIRVTAVRDIYENGSWRVETLADLSNFEGESVEKVYRKRKEEEFDGFLVGITHIVTTGRIGTDYDEVVWDMEGHTKGIYHLTRETDMTKVAVVYFKNNAKRTIDAGRDSG